MRRNLSKAYAALLLYFLRVGPRHNLNSESPVLQLVNNVNDLSVAHIGAVFFKGNAEHAHGGIGHFNAVFKHKANKVTRYLTAHVVVNRTA